MCGIIGIVGKSDVQNRLVESLLRLEYRGYDSAGVAGLTAPGQVERRRAQGKIRALQDVLAAQPLVAKVGTKFVDAYWIAETGRRPSATPTRIPPAASPWSTTESSRISPSCAGSWKPTAGCSPATPTPR